MASNLLAIETSSEACSVALAMKGEILQRHLHAPLRHADLLLPALRALLDEADARLSSLDAIAFGRGPGSFTSLRIGIGVVQGLAWGSDLPVIPVSSLASVAQQAIGDRVSSRCNILVAMDARMNEVFHCSYALCDEGFPMPRIEESVAPPDAIAVGEAGSTIGAGNGFERYAALRALAGSLQRVQPELLPSAAALIPLAAHWLKRHRPLPAAEAQPVYIRNRVAVPVAETHGREE